ncbi:MAG: hypothetical protein MJ097_02735 [Dorea sp.]|nr:hypothetical protein [Dorea sp.]
MNRYIGIAADQKLAEEIKDKIRLADGQKYASLLWQDTEALLIELGDLSDTMETYPFTELLEALLEEALPYMILSREELKNSPAEILEYLDAIQWMRIRKSPSACKEIGQETYQALILGQMEGIPDLLREGAKGVEASSEKMKEYCECFARLSKSVEEKVEQARGRCYLQGGSVEVVVPVHMQSHQLFTLCQLLKTNYECQTLSDVYGEGGKLRLQVQIFPAEMDELQVKKLSKARMKQNVNQDVVAVSVERRCGQPMNFSIPADRLADLDGRILFTCKNIGHGADYIQLLSQSVYDKDLLMYCRFLNRECR